MNGDESRLKEHLDRRIERMADNGGGGSTGVLAILVIFLIVVVAGLIVFGGRFFGTTKRVDINITTPSK
ncbi:MAG TPA: hypothetical protein VN920_14045 [Pyrinomonadaceae bacterium]|nr:hypothetical protein [Pyrinomonadaceae bacterium]